ncbi:MAG: type II toxin-antitoxin system VapC family toxin [Nakamurella sp.]
MIVDASALVAVAAAEPTGSALQAVLRSERSLAMSAGTHLETFIVADRHPNPNVARNVEALIRSSQIHILPFTATQAQIARAGYRDFGKGSGHPAGLNFGDCFSYALAIDSGEPLLFVGNDFTHTDVQVARY